MSVLKELKAAIGAGQLKVDVECEEELHLGDEVHGVATITGGEVPQIVQGLDVRLTYRWPVQDEAAEQEDVGSRTLHRASVEVQIDVEPGSVHRVPFTLTVPSDTALAEAGDWHTIDVSADIPHAVDVAGSRRVTLRPARRVLEALDAVLATDWILDGYQPNKAHEGFVRAVLSPGPTHAARFDRVYLELSRDPGPLRVNVTFDLKEKLWRELTGTDKHHHSFEVKDVPDLVARLQEMIKTYSTRG